MRAHVARQPNPPHPVILLCNPVDHVRRTITGMIVDEDHLPIEVLARKCLCHLFIKGYDVIRFVEGGNDETDKSRHVRVAPSRARAWFLPRHEFVRHNGFAIGGHGSMDISVGF